MRDRSPEVAELEQRIFALAPGFEWCGGCGTPSRYLTDEEGVEILTLVAGYVAGGGTGRDALDALYWLMECHGRTGYAGTCGCPPAPPVIPRTGCYLYRLWGENDRLLYVGVSIRLASRLKCHRRKWGDLIEREEWQEYPDERAMLDAERVAIQDECPAFNKAGVS